MTLSLQELADARAEMGRAFEQIWPDPDCPCPNSPPCFAELDALEQRYRRALRTIIEIRQTDDAPKRTE